MALIMIDMTTHVALSWATIVRKIVAATKQATIGQTITGYPIRTTVGAIAKASRRAAAHTRKRMVTEGFLPKSEPMVHITRLRARSSSMTCFGSLRWHVGMHHLRDKLEASWE